MDKNFDEAGKASQSGMEPIITQGKAIYGMIEYFCILREYLMKIIIPLYYFQLKSSIRMANQLTITKRQKDATGSDGDQPVKKFCRRHSRDKRIRQKRKENNW